MVDDKRGALKRAKWPKNWSFCILDGEMPVAYERLANDAEMTRAQSDF